MNIKSLLIVSFCLCLPLAGADKKPLTKEKSAKAIEQAIRAVANKNTGELTKADFEKVTKLKLSMYNTGNQLTSVKGLEKLTQLTGLYLDGNKLTDVKGLEKLSQLKILTLYGNQLTDVKGLEKLTQLTALVLHANQLTDVKGLEKLTQLEGLRLSNNKLTDVKGLEKLNQLTELGLGGNPDLTKAQIDELQKALPNCQIFHNAKK